MRHGGPRWCGRAHSLPHAGRSRTTRVGQRAGSGSSRASRSRREVRRSRDLDHARGWPGASVRHCTSSSRRSACSSREQVDQPDQRDLGRVASPGGTSTPRRTGRRSRRRTARRPAARRARPRPSAPSPARAGARYAAPDVAVDPAAGRARVGAGVDHLGEGGVDPDLEAPHRPAQRAGHHAARPAAGPRGRTGQNQHIGSPRPPRRHREQPAPVRRQQGARLEVGAHRDQVVVGVEPRRVAGKPQAVGGGSTGTARR